MKRVMIVDDEFLVRIGIKSMLNWEEHGYTIVAEAINGEDAMEKIERFRPQVVLTDLVMEPVDGLALLDWCMAHHPEIKVVVLSNYNDFEKVKAAMKLGASDFFFKLTVSVRELEGVLAHLSRQIDQGRMSERAAEQLISKNAGAIRRRLMREMAQSTYASEAETLMELKSIDVRCDMAKPYRVMLLRLQDAALRSSAEPDMLQTTFENMVDERMADTPGAQTFRGAGATCVVVVNEPEGAELVETLRAAHRRIDDTARRYIGFPVQGALSGTHEGIAPFAKAMAACERALNQCYFMKQNVLAEDAPLTDPWPTGFSPSAWRASLACGHLDEARHALAQWREAMWDRKMDVSAVRARLFELYSLLKSDSLEKDDGSFRPAEAQGGALYDIIYQSDHLETVVNAFLDALKRCEQRRAQPGARTIKREIAAVVAYVNAQPEREIGIAEAARMAHMSQSYFSRLFKSEMGVGFVDYVNGVRVEKAKHLLRNSDLRIGEIAAAVGIDNQNYFSILFKKTVGMPPGEYRNR